MLTGLKKLEDDGKYDGRYGHLNEEPAYVWTETEPDSADSDELLLARAMFDAQEFLRCAHLLDRSCTSAPHSPPDLTKLSPKALSLRCYALYLVCGHLSFIKTCKLCLLYVNDVVVCIAGWGATEGG